MRMHTAILEDMGALRTALSEHGIDHRPLLEVGPLRPLADVAFDVTVAVAATAAVVEFGALAAPASVLLIGNRQRALGNVLHDAAHRNLSRQAHLNDALSVVLIAPLAFASLSAYRDAHFAHHLALGTRDDPDLLPASTPKPLHWRAEYWRHAWSVRAWWGNAAGHLGNPSVGGAARLWILVWWVMWLALVGAVLGWSFAVVFGGLWLLSRATAFHAITMMREMCDHYGLQRGGVFSFTRDMVCHGFWRWLIHPRNNGYHLTHHLLPAVPYHRLPEAHAAFMGLPAIQRRATVCDAYFHGPQAVVRAWQRPAQSDSVVA
jgi:fatty acid desaturase